MRFLALLLLASGPSMAAFAFSVLPQKSAVRLLKTTTQLSVAIDPTSLGASVEEKDPIAPIAVGESLPEDAPVVLCQGFANGSGEADGEAIPIKDVVGSGKALLIGMPGAFTPTCTAEHLPGYVDNLPKFKKMGYDTVAVLTTNDRYVMDQWSQAVGTTSTDIQMLSDGSGTLVEQLGLSQDLGFGVGKRSKRFALALRDGTVTHAFTDQGMKECSATSADNLLQVLATASSTTMDDSTNPGIAALLLVALVGAAAYVGMDPDMIANLHLSIDIPSF